MPKQKPIIIAIAAVSGGGKTTITTELSKHLDNAKALFFDDYDFDNCPDDICEWVDSGADYNAWHLEPLIADIKLLLSEENQSLKYILLDYPFAYKNKEMGQFIDFTIFIDTPLDIAMARRISRDFTHKTIEILRMDINNYLSRGRIAYLEMLNTIKPNSDFVIDGSLSTIAIVNKILKELKKERYYEE